MELFKQTFGFVAAICGGIIILTLFFMLVSFFKGKIRGFDVVKMNGFIKDGKLVNVHLSSGKIVTEVRFIGFTSQTTGKGGIPYQLASMVVLETTKGARVLIRADTVRMFEETDNCPALSDSN
jgi:hypothetical protein